MHYGWPNNYTANLVSSKVWVHIIHVIGIINTIIAVTVPLFNNGQLIIFFWYSIGIQYKGKTTVIHADHMYENLKLFHAYSTVPCFTQATCGYALVTLLRLNHAILCDCKLIHSWVNTVFDRAILCVWHKWPFTLVVRPVGVLFWLTAWYVLEAFWCKHCQHFMHHEIPFTLRWLRIILTQLHFLHYGENKENRFFHFLGKTCFSLLFVSKDYFYDL